MNSKLACMRRKSRRTPQESQDIHYELLLFIAPNIRSRRSSTVQLISFVDKDDDAECPGPRFVLGRKLNEPESTPCERLSINRPICAEELWKTLQQASTGMENKV